MFWVNVKISFYNNDSDVAHWDQIVFGEYFNIMVGEIAVTI